MGRFINADQQFGPSIIEKNLYSYCKNLCTISFDNDGRRTYFLNGINNFSQDGVPDYAKTFSSKLMKKGIKDVRNIGLYKSYGKSTIVSTISGVAKVIMEMFNINVYTNCVVDIIKADKKKAKIPRGEQLNLIGYSGGWQIALNVMTKIKNAFNHVVLIGSPVLKSWRSTTKVSLIYAGWDPLSWNIGWGFKSYFAGWFGHTNYFDSKYIDKVVNIVDKIIN